MKLLPLSSLMLALLLGALPSAHAAAITTTARPGTDYEGEYANFAQWQEVNQFIDEMVSRHGFTRAELTLLMNQVRYVEDTIALIKPAPLSKPKNWHAYRQRFVEPVRIEAGLKFWSEHSAALARAEHEYGVPAEIIVGIIGVETVYGRNTGRFRVLDALTTLAFSYPPTPNRVARMAFFRAELESALVYARASQIDPFSLLGSYAGAIGLPQFMPSSILNDAVDFDGDGKIDLRFSATDAIGSVAHFLIQHGWQRNDLPPLVYPATLTPEPSWQSLLELGLSATLTPEQLLNAGVNSSIPLPEGMRFGLVNLQNGAEETEYWLATNNFFAITQYNRSYFYAMSVIELGRAIRLRRGL